VRPPLELRRVVQDELLGDPIQTIRPPVPGGLDMAASARVVARDLRLDDRALLDGADRLAGLPLSAKMRPCLCLDQRGDPPSVHREIHQDGRSRMSKFHCRCGAPGSATSLARLDVQRDDAAAERL